LYGQLSIAKVELLDQINQQTHPSQEDERSMIRHKRYLPTLLLGLVMVAATCAAGPAGAQTTTTTAAAKAKIPAGTVIKVGDQLDYLKTVLKLSGEDENFPYEVQYSAFVGGPPMLQAFQAGAIDSGFVGSTPLIFAQAGNQDITAVASWATANGTYGLLTSPGTKDIKGWKDLKGKKVTYQQGTAGEAALLQALDKVGLKLSDVTPVNLPITQASAALQSGAADAGLLVEPLISVYLTANPTAKQVDKASVVTDRSSFFIATDDALGDKAKSAALADYIGRLVRGFQYTSEHPDEVAQAVYVDQYKLPLERALEIVKENGGTSFVTLPGAVVKAQQQLADLFYEAGEIPAKVDVKKEFSTKYNAIVAAAARQSAP
jgi:sulfonate transport system substrate-binding protein